MTTMTTSKNGTTTNRPARAADWTIGAPAECRDDVARLGLDDAVTYCVQLASDDGLDIEADDMRAELERLVAEAE